MAEGFMRGSGSIPDAKIVSEMSPSIAEKGDIRKDPRSFPLRIARVTRVDPKRMVVDILPQDEQMPRKNVPLSFPGAGGRHFLGSMPEVNDICVVGSLPAESGMNSAPVILSWFPPGVKAGYDWIPFRSHSPEEIGITPTESTSFEGMLNSRRYKLRQMETGHFMASSSQGSDVILDESVTISNRRGNEIILRDQDQAILMRSLQQFAVGAGYRVYGGMVQRDSSLIPNQVITQETDWSSNRQVDGDGVPLSQSEFDSNDDAGSFNPSYVFSTEEDGVTNTFGLEFTTDTNPSDILRRGLFIDEEGFVVDDKVSRGSVYGGKRIFRVSTDLSDGTSNPGSETFSEYRIEVNHTSDGVIPVTEQTDGIDIDRLLPNPPNPDDPDLKGDNRAPSPMVEFVLGTAVGNDSTNDRESYGVPLVAKVTSKDGRRETIIRPADPGDSVEDHIAFLVRVRNPLDPSVVSFIGITKGGAYLNSFQGHGSKVVQEDFRTGKQSFYGTDNDGQSRVVEGEGTLSFSNVGSGRPTDNVGIELSSSGGAVVLSSGGNITEGAALGGLEQNSSPAKQRVGMKLDSATGTLLSAKGAFQIKSPEVEVSDAKTITNTASSSFSVNSGDSVSVSSKTLGFTVNGAAEYVFGGPKDGLATNGPSRSTSFTANPLTGAIGGVVDRYSVLFGGRTQTFRLGRDSQTINVGSFDVRTMGVGVPKSTPGAGFSIVTGFPLLDNGISATPVSVSVKANAGVASLKSTKGPVSISGTAGTFISSIAKTQISAPYVNVIAPASPFGGVLTDGCLDSLTGRPFLLSGTIGAPTFRVGP